jgi:hypothetical protein
MRFENLGKKGVKYFASEMGYAFYHFESSPFKNSWLGYLITQNGYPEELESKKSSHRRKQPLNIKYKMNMVNYEMLTPHQTFKVSGNLRQKVDL